MFDLLGTIKEKTGLGGIGDTLSSPKSVQDVFDIKTVYPDGIFCIGKDKWSVTLKFTDINYAVSSKADKEEYFFKYSDLLNSLENDVSTQITIINRRINNDELERITLNEAKGDGNDKYRREINDMLLSYANNAGTIVQDKYITLTVTKRTYEEARTALRTMCTNIKQHFTRVGSKCSELELPERLRIIHDFCRPGEEADFHFDLNDTLKKGHSFKDYISPDGFSFEKDHFVVGSRFARVLFLRDYPSYIKDSVIWEMTDSARNMIFNYDIIPISTEEAIKFVEKQALGVETNISNFQRKQTMNNNSTAIIPHDMIVQRNATQEMLNDISDRDQKLFKVIMTVMISADSLAELDELTEAVSSTARKHMCQFGVLKYQQIEGFNP